MRKKFLNIFFLLTFLMSFCNFAFSETSNGFYDLDFNFIDNPFAGQKIITDKEFNQTYDKYKSAIKQKKTGGFWNWIFRHTLPKDKQYQEPVKDSPMNYSDEIRFQKETLSQKPTIILSSTIYDSEGNEIKPGHYQVSVENSTMKFTQGFDTIAVFKASKTKDNWDANKIIYARVTYPSEDVVKIIQQEDAY